MGTTLTGTTPQDTYDSLIKVTDNGPLSGSLKTLTDGLGNDSALALSTGEASVTGTLAVSSGITSTGANTMLSASSSTQGLVVRGGSSIGTASTASGQILIGQTATYRGSIAYDDNAGYLYIDNLYNNNAGNIYFRTKTQGTAVEALTILGSGNVGIGTSAPDKKLQVVGPVGVASTTSVLNSSNTGIYASTGGNTSNYNGIFFQGVSSKDMYFGRKGEAGVDDLVVSTAEASPIEIARFRRDGGLTFNGDTAAANALDDYEEGTFTAYLVPPTSGTITLDPTYSTWSYTKVGRKVTINGVAVISAVSSPVGAYFTMTTLPFTIITANSGYGSGSATLSDQSASYAKSTIPVWHSVGNVALNFGLDASTLAAADEIYVTATYFV